MMLHLIIMGVGVIVSFIKIFQLGILFLVPSVMAAVFFSYSFTCVYSLYEIIKAEKVLHKTNVLLPQTVVA
jgi:hypothetical protein